MIEKLRLRGMTGIKRGMGLDEIEIDFTGRTGLLAFDGQNGIGKSSTLDHLSPFALIPSREGSLSQHVCRRDSEKEMSFTHNGNAYRTLIKIDSESGKSEGFAWKNGEPLLKGKISEYHRWAAQEFGTPELFFASIFSAQNGKKISDMTVGALKSLFVEFLRLERYEAWADTAKQAGNVLNGKLAGLDQRLLNLQENIGARDLKETERMDAGSRAEGLRDDKTALEHALAEKRRQIDTLKETINKNALALERKRDIQAQIDRLEKELATEKEAATAEINALSRRWLDLSGRVTECGEILQDRGKIEHAAELQRDLENSLVILQQEVDRLTAEAGEHQERAHELELQIIELKQNLRTPETDPENMRLGTLIEDAEREIREKQKEFAALNTDPKMAACQAEINSLERAALVGAGIDTTCQSATCAAINSVNEARGKLPKALAELDKRKAEIKVIMTDILNAIAGIKEREEKAIAEKEARVRWVEQWNKDADEEIKIKAHALRNIQQVILGSTELAAAKRQCLAKTRLEIAQQKALADRLPEIQVAEARKADLEKQLQDVTNEGSSKKNGWLLKEDSFNSAIKSLVDDRMVLDGQIDDTAEPKLETVQREINELTNLIIPGIEKEIQAARDKMAALQAELTRIEAAEKELGGVRKEREALTLKISRWRYLQNACGKNGLQSLEIDGAAPLISARANELLHMGYGPQFSIRIDTQDAEGREDLDIKVISEFGEDSLKQKSGGEKIWLLHPIRLAMTLLSKEKSGRNWDYAAFDECDGPLDAKGAATNFMEMYRPFLEIGGFKQLFYITHREECLGYADHILRFEKGKNPSWG